MNKVNNVLAIAYFTTSLIAGIFLGASFPTSFGEVGGWLYNWQPLLAGSLAIFVAFITILQMRKSDELTEDRHRELINLNLRSDALKVERACYPSMKDAESLLVRLEVVTLEISRFIDAGLSPNGSSKKINAELMSVANDIEEFVGRRQLKDVQNMLDGAGYRALDEVKSDAKTLKTCDLNRYSEQVAGLPVPNVQMWMNENESAMSESLGGLKAGLTFLIVSLQFLEEAYAGVHTHPKIMSHD
ncbi:hypothetical protein [Hoeflea poritis]|uniref:Uncharacterized protein n=1 Tax=Hoeflea poritis TaxID=2993659 RepID=A0ABT4VSW0_9HYPH|nr:hypothetical protein [Hoeflea poritis]MDA4847275.1 hypothetical protein [Hoeflea poritis]